MRSRLSEGFYTLSNLIFEVHLERDVRDFRIDRQEVVEALLSMGEYHHFSKAMFEWVGFTRLALAYEYVPRESGVSAWSFWKLFKMA
ncbi:hypothetical protein [Helicobacter sp. MIT 14-3879]|uniref:hypothetical protein n=1 Tax=Helicobacter sp. MIT 14-3879 TaxID=2040649 RepID=UPI00216346B8|nr:hypothetical protein [Helicobacter sp. MIT 14-3879]